MYIYIYISNIRLPLHHEDKHTHTHTHTHKHTHTYIYIYIYIYIHMCVGGCPCGVRIKALDYRSAVSDFELQSGYYVHFKTNILGKVMNPLIPTVID